MKRQHLLLLLLLFLLAGSVTYSILASPRQERISVKKTGEERTGRPSLPEADRGNGSRLRIDLLEESPRPYAGVKRDLFYGSAPPVVAVAVKKIAPPPPPVIVAPPPPPPPPTAEELMRRELGRFTFLGYLEKEGRRTVFLRADGEPFVVKLGERFGKQKQFLVVSLSPTRMEVRSGNDPQIYPIVLVEQEALTPALPVSGGGTSPSTLGTSPSGPLPVARPLRAGGSRAFGAMQPGPGIQPQGDPPREEMEPEEAQIETTPPPAESVPEENEPPQPEGQANGTEE